MKGAKATLGSHGNEYIRSRSTTPPAMREATYILKNEERWKSFEALVNSMDQASPQQLTDAYVALTDDLAFAQAQYPGRMVTQYLNQLVGKIHVVLMRTRSERLERLKWFFVRELPMAMSGIRFELKIVAVMFFFTVGIGFFGGWGRKTWLVPCWGISMWT